jgi:23S rRNA (uracil1939-C5)-methyltransferase
VQDARENAKRNGIENAEFFCGDAGKAALDLEKQGIRPDVIVVDPPRKGLNGDTIAALGSMAPRRIVYVSCDPATLARDVALLKERGYRVKNAQAADLFPRCAHVETIVCLSKLADTHIEMEIDPEELDTITAKVSPTYPEIKAYVLEHHGLKVSSLAIAQTKKKCGLEVGECYNLPSGHGRPPTNLTPEREAAIREAFQYYGLI